jgi:DNA polymerase I-like protein with 3'-5' exonuclease and polymerase domains
MVNIHEKGIIPLIQIHDEVAFSSNSQEKIKMVASIMENAVPLSVPSKVDIEVGPSWGETKSIFSSKAPSITRIGGANE